MAQTERERVQTIPLHRHSSSIRVATFKHFAVQLRIFKFKLLVANKNLVFLEIKNDLIVKGDNIQMRFIFIFFVNVNVS